MSTQLINSLIVVVYLYLDILGVSLTIAGQLFTEIPFAENVAIHGRNITCKGKSPVSKYTSPMYFCDDIRVDGAPLLHGYNDKSIYPDNVDEPKCLHCPCGPVYDVQNDVTALCEALLKQNKIPFKDVAVVFIPDPVCTQKDKEHRVKYYKDPISGKTEWLDVHANNGYLSKIQCVISSKGGKVANS